MPDLWQKLTNRPIVTVERVFEDPILGGMSDGYQHRRLVPVVAKSNRPQTYSTGWVRPGPCMACGAPEGAEHNALAPTRRDDAPIYWRLVEQESTLLRYRAHLMIAGVDAVDVADLVSRKRARLRG